MTKHECFVVLVTDSQGNPRVLHNVGYPTIVAARQAAAAAGLPVILNSIQLWMPTPAILQPPEDVA